MDVNTDSKSLYMIVRGGFNLETEDGGREIKKAGDTIELTEDEARRHGRNVKRVSVATIDAGGVLPVQESVNVSDVELEPDISTPALVDHSIWDVVAETETEADPEAVDWSYIHAKKVDLVLGIVRTADVSNLPALRAVEMLNPSGPRVRIISAIDKRLQAIAQPKMER